MTGLVSRVAGLFLGWFWAGFDRQETHQPRSFGPIRLVLKEYYRRTFKQYPWSVAAAIGLGKIRKTGRIGPNVRGKWLCWLLKSAQKQPVGLVSP